MSTARQVARLAALRLVGPPLALMGSLAGRSTRGRTSGDTGGRPRILLIRPDHLGDVLLASPVAALLREALPDATIDWLVGPWAAEMARRAGSDGAVTTLAFPGFARRAKSSPIQPYALLAREAARLGARGYDAAIILRADHWWGAMLAAAAGIPRRFGFSVAECLPFLTDTLPPSQGHAVRTNQELARLAALRLGGCPPRAGAYVDPTFSIEADELAWARSWLAEHLGAATRVQNRNNGSRMPVSEPVVAIHPGSGAVLKNWSAERWAQVASALREQRGARIFLTGGPDEHDMVEAIASRLDPRPPTIVGETSLGQLAALFACSDMVLGCDSGPMHLAAAVGPRTVRIYGPTDTREFGPWTPRGRMGQHWPVSGFVECQPCRALVDPPCGATEWPACMRAVVPAAVASKALELLTFAGPDPGSDENVIVGVPRAT